MANSFFTHKHAMLRTDEPKKYVAPRRVSVQVKDNLQRAIDIFKADAEKQGYEYKDAAVLSTMIEVGFKIWMAEYQTRMKAQAEITEPEPTPVPEVDFDGDMNVS